MSGPPVRLAGVVIGVTSMAGAGLLAGGWWWIAALVGAVAAAGSVADRQLAHAQVLATLVLAVGLSAAAAVWFVPVLVGGTIGAIEIGAAADRTTVVRPAVPELGRVILTIPAAAAVAGFVLVLAELPVAAFSGTVVAAAVAGVVAMRVIAR